MLTVTNWQLQTPINAIIFDCDGTLSAIEGIDELAKENHVGAAVQFLTSEAMGKTGINPDLYKERLDLVRPNKAQIDRLGETYYNHRAPDANEVIKIFQRLNKTIYIISAGLAPAVTQFGDYFNIPATNIFAVDISFDADGNYIAFDNKSPMTRSNGKRNIISDIKLTSTTVAHIGDGLNDFIAHDLSTRFIGFGGFFYRKHIAADCEFYIKAKSLSAMLPLLLTRDETQQLRDDEKHIYEKGMTDIQSGLVEINKA